MIEVKRLMEMIKMLNSREIENIQKRYSIKIIAKRLTRIIVRLSATYFLNFMTIWRGCNLDPF